MRKKADIEIVAPDKKRHRQAMAELMVRTFGFRPRYWEAIDYVRTVYNGSGHYDWNASRIGLADGEVVCHFGVWNYTVRIGCAQVRMGGIGAVSTDTRYQRRGYIRKLALAAIDAMRENNYDISLLFGIRDLYHKFGYARAWSDTHYTLRLSDLPHEKSRLKLREFKIEPRKDIAALHNRQNRGMTGTAVRPTFTHGRYPDLPKAEGYRWLNAKGKTAGYVCVDPRDSALCCFDYAGNAADALHALAILARRKQFRELSFITLPERSPLLTMLRRGTCDAETKYIRSGGPMIRVINLASTLEKIAPELEKRLKASHMAKWAGDLLIANNEEKAVLCIRRGQVTPARKTTSRHAIRGGDEIGCLIYGSDNPRETVGAHNTRLRGDAKALLPVLFPDQQPGLHLMDRF